MRRVLLLGGTGDAATLATQISALPNVEVVTSLAGRTKHPSSLPGTVRIGGFGGVAGLIAYLQENRIDVLIDATHPFAAQISWNAAIATQTVGIPHRMLVRPAWQKTPGDRWIEVASIEMAAKSIPANASRVFLTIGRQHLTPFASKTQTWFLMRSIDQPPLDAALPTGTLLLARGPFSVAQERQLLQDHQIDAIVSKNSGGDATYAKIIAARELNLPVIMVQRPAIPPVGQDSDVEAVLSWLIRLVSD